MRRPETEIDERRISQRQAARSRVQVTIETDALVGYADNISQTGVLFFSESQLEVMIEMDDNGKQVKRKGRLVRAQRMQGDSTGWAVEFDEV
jgi:hypothetical protein